jgi:hypothetical protein
MTEGRCVGGLFFAGAAPCGGRRRAKQRRPVSSACDWLRPALDQMIAAPDCPAEITAASEIEMGEAFRRHQVDAGHPVGRAAVMCAVRRLSCWVAAEAKITVPTRVADRPVAGRWSEREDGESGCRGARRGGLFRRRRGGARNAAAVCPGGNRGDGLFDLGNRYRLHGQQVEHDADAARDAAVAVLPTPDVSRGDVEQPGDARLCNAERAERRAEFDRSR